ncbi:acyltransferase [Roseimicrobium gellanilyticum]|uniref:acyltransferase n=1 Tax=Roseimicrobium gellanilyticum TaxID=748857 RepID=UPI001B87176A|nr:hypothetical protein [Roseimicrobium gellanilyticum]
MEQSNHASVSRPPSPWPASIRAVMLLLNLVPLAHAALTLWIGFAISWLGAVACLYLAPPVLLRVVLLAVPLIHGTHAPGSRAFLIWWASSQPQVIFSRLPLLEELLRMVPGLYSLWLRLWGSKIGRLTYWAPGVRVLDRTLLRIGDDVVLGAGARLIAHVVSNNAEGQTVLHVAPIEIGDRCRIGGYALLSPGSVVDADEEVHICALFPPFTHWKEGRRSKLAVVS